MAALRTPLYREFLTPNLHRRFTSAAAPICVLSYVVAVFIGDKSSFLWSWFPIGPAGIRALLLFISALSIFVLRVAQLHIGTRTSAAPFETFTKYLIRLNTIQTLAWYLFSAWWFSEVYMWSVPGSADLGWVSEGKAWERKRLNERPIYLRSVFFMLAILQSIFHLYYDYDKVTISPSQPKAGSSIQHPPTSQTPSIQLKQSLPLLGRSIAIRAAGMSILGPLIYAIFIRSTAWSVSLYIAAILWDVPSSRLSYIPPYHISLILRSLTSGACLMTLWAVSNQVFGVYCAQEPLKREQPLTSESRDPNGSLLIGLKSKKEVARSFAFWELAFISQRFVARRKAIFSDIDRPGGSAWNQIMTLSLGNVLAIINRISEYQTAKPSAAAPQQQPVTIETLPRITSNAVQQENVFTNPLKPSNRREMIESNIGSIAKSYGQSPTPVKAIDFLKSQRAESTKYLNSTGQKLLTQGQQESLSKSGLLAQYNEYLIRFLRTPAGYPFRRTFKRRVLSVVLGSPYGELNPIIDSINTLIALAQASLTEDPYGKVAKDVPLMIRAFTSTMSAIENFVGGLPPHWTDVEFQESDRKIEEVDLILAALRSGLREMVSAFGKYASELGMSNVEIETARKVAGTIGGDDALN